MKMPEHKADNKVKTLQSPVCCQFTFVHGRVTESLIPRLNKQEIMSDVRELDGPRDLLLP